MIKTFKDKYTQQLFQRKRVLKWKHIEQIARLKLKELDKAISLEELARIPSNRLHKLTRDRKGQQSLTIKINIAFVFTE
jgi:proteic killer suppression protein